MGSDSNKPPVLGQKAIFYMCLLALQFGMQPALTRRFTPEGICRSTVILMQEALKFFIGFTMLNLSGERQNALQGESYPYSYRNILRLFQRQVKKMFFSHSPSINTFPVPGWKLSTWMSVAFVPAALYALQNIAALQAYQNLDALTFNVLNQTKTLSAALCCYLVMGRKQSTIQVGSLFLLLFSALIMEKVVPLGSPFAAGAHIEMPEWSSNHWSLGVAPIMLASFISGLSGAISQKNLQTLGPGGRNPFLFSMELCAASAFILGFSLLLSSDGERIAKNGFWDGWTATTWIPIITNSIGGIIVGLVTKYAGSVRKGFALIFGILLSGIAQAVIEPDVGISQEQFAGGVLAGLAMWMHATNPPKEKSKAKTD